jgi:hypothetical protein
MPEAHFINGNAKDLETYFEKLVGQENLNYVYIGD